MTLINLTPHDINIVIVEGGDKITVPPSGIIARVSSNQKEVFKINNIPVYQTVFGEVENLPEPQNDTIYIVSTMVLSALEKAGIDRTDVVAPNTINAIRENGQVVAITSFQVL